jgi:hypothetical protein
MPDRMGKFRDGLRFRQICRECNSRIGAHEEQLLRCAPESHSLRVLNPATARARRGTKRVGAKDLAPPEVVHLWDDHEERVRYSKDGKRIEKFEHLDILPEKGEAKFIELVPMMSAHQLRARVKALVLGAIKDTRIHALAENWDRYKALVAEAWPKSNFIDRGRTEVGYQVVPVRQGCRVSKGYWQAVAKIAFHYFLVTSARGYTGAEDDFRQLREFVRNGVGAVEHFFCGPAGLGRMRVPPALTDPAGVRLDQWRHLLMLDESKVYAQVGMSLFVGPPHQPTSMHVLKLGRFRSNLIVPGLKNAHAYVYFAHPDENGYAGRVVQIKGW